MAPVTWKDWDGEDEESWAVSTLCYVPPRTLTKRGTATKARLSEEPPGGVERDADESAPKKEKE